MRSTRRDILALVLGLSAAPAAFGATSTRDVPSPLSGNGHNVTFDGRLFVVARSPGWEATVLRPERVTIVDGFPSVSDAFSPAVLVQPGVNNENALALCEADPGNTPFRCDAAGARSPAGAFACYDLAVIDSDALASEARNFILRRRNFFVRVRDPGTPAAQIEQFEWRGAMQPLTTTLRGIEPTVSRDGRLMVWQGHASNDGQIDFIMYSYNPNPCAVAGWSAPRNLSAMFADPNPAVRAYRLAERQLRASTGEMYTAAGGFRGAYPWLFPDADALIFTAVNMPCRGPEDPGGCGPRRNAISVIGYPTNWGLAHVDGAVNPDTDQTVRLFFSSPGPALARPLPFTAGRDVWPFFGSNTSNYTELVFDDGLDGNYGGIWHMNEAVSLAAEYNRGATPDTSGFFNTGRLVGGASYPLRNNGFLGKAIEFNGTDGRVEVPNAASLNPVNALTVELRVLPSGLPDCDSGNNYRWLLRKGTGYSLVFEDDGQLHARVGVGSAEYEVWSGAPLVAGVWTHVAFTYEGATGRLALFLDGREVASTSNPPGTLSGSTEVLRIGGLGARPACPTSGEGSFRGAIDEVAVSRIVRYGATAPPVVDAGSTDSGTMIVDASMDEDAGSSTDARTMPGSDARAVDAAPDARRDGGMTDGPLMGACGCRALPGRGAGVGFAGAALIAASVTRRRRRRTG